MASSNHSQLPASRSIRSFLHLQPGRGSSPATTRPPPSVTRLTDEFLRAVSGVGAKHGAHVAPGAAGDLDEDVVAKMLSDGARLYDTRLQKNSLAAANSNVSPRVRRAQNPVLSGSSTPPRSSDRRSRAPASATKLVTGSIAMSPAVASAVGTHTLAQQQLPKPVAQPPPSVPGRTASPAAHAPPHLLPEPSQHQAEPYAENKADDTGSRSVGRHAATGGALAVLNDLADIREMKADYLERSLERESVISVSHSHINLIACVEISFRIRRC
jgi:hypothetical protein